MKRELENISAYRQAVQQVMKAQRWLVHALNTPRSTIIRLNGGKLFLTALTAQWGL